MFEQHIKLTELKEDAMNVDQMVSDLCEYQSTRLKNLEKHSQKSVKKCLERQIKKIMEQVDQSD